jgi:hypothetical protein
VPVNTTRYTLSSNGSCGIQDSHPIPVSGLSTSKVKAVSSKHLKKSHHDHVTYNSVNKDKNVLKQGWREEVEALSSSAPMPCLLGFRSAAMHVLPIRAKRSRSQG